MLNNFIILAINEGGVVVSRKVLIGVTPEQFEVAKRQVERMYGQCFITFFNEKELDQMVRTIQEAKPRV